MRGEDQVRPLVVAASGGSSRASRGRRRRRRRWRIAARRAVAQRGEVGDEADEPEEQRDREVGGDREHVPESGLLKFGQMPIWFGIGSRKYANQTRPTWMPGKMQRADDGEDRHRLRGAVDRRAPLLAEQEENGGDQRAGVTDTDPQDEVRDVPGPEDRGCCCPRRRCRSRPGRRWPAPSTPVKLAAMQEERATSRAGAVFSVTRQTRLGDRRGRSCPRRTSGVSPMRCDGSVPAAHDYAPISGFGLRILPR